MVFDEEVEDPVADLTTATDGLSKSFTVPGKDIVVDSASTVFKNTNFASLTDNDIVEVSGYFGAGSQLRANEVASFLSVSLK